MELSPIELRILCLIVEEKTSAAIAKLLCVSVHTINNHRKSMLEKTNSKTPIGLVAKAFRLGLVK